MTIEFEDRIRVRAYHLWEASGRPEGRDLEFWEQARRTIPQGKPTASKGRAVQSSTAAPAVVKAAKRSRSRAKEHSD